MPMQSQRTNRVARRGILALSLWLVVGATYAQAQTPFQGMAGQWTGSGTLEFSNGQREPVRCRAAYDVLGERNQLQFDIRCASESYHFDFRGSAISNGGNVSGNWSEVTRNASGTISGKAQRGRFQVLATGPAFTANLILATRGKRQSVTIKSPDPESSLRGASISLQRR